MRYSNDLLRHATEQSNRIEQEPVKGKSFDNHWRATLLCRRAAEHGQVIHPCVLHQLLFEGIPINSPPQLSLLLEPGAYREFDVAVNLGGGKTHTFAPHADLTILMDEWWQEYLKILEVGKVFAAIDLRQDHIRWDFHAWFEAIHPFPDGNGRVGRMLWWNMAMLVGVTIEVVTYEERYAYYDRLEQWREAHSNSYLMNPFR